MKLHIIGRIDSAMSQYFEAHFNNLKNVQYHGRVEDVTTMLENKDLCVIPSLTDAGPYVALEAAHYGVPVVLTSNCGSAELLSRDPDGSKIIPIRNSVAIKNAILWAYNNRQEAIIMGRTGKELLDSYNMEEFIIKVADYLEEKMEGVNS
jgi:glycosyltransferase involved in cell wall biosynthesis